jgi:hypothetical protein
MINWNRYEPNVEYRHAVQVTDENIENIARSFWRPNNTVTVSHGPNGSSITIERSDETFVCAYVGQMLVMHGDQLQAVDFNDFNKQWRPQCAWIPQKSS